MVHLLKCKKYLTIVSGQFGYVKNVLHFEVKEWEPLTGSFYEWLYRGNFLFLSKEMTWEKEGQPWRYFRSWLKNVTFASGKSSRCGNILPITIRSLKFVWPVPSMLKGGPIESNDN